MIELYDFVYGNAGGHALRADLHAPDPVPGHLRPGVLWVHGGGWIGGERTWCPNQMLVNAGFVTMTISYRYSPEAGHPAQIHDVKAGIRWFRAHAAEYGMDPTRIGIWGHSAGGHLSALSAVTNGMIAFEGASGTPDGDSSVQCAVPLSPPTELCLDWYAVHEMPMHPEALVDVGGLLGGPPWERTALAREASPYWNATPQAAPQLIVHGTVDDLVPVGQARAYVSLLNHLGAEAELIEVPDGDHEITRPFYEGEPDPLGLRPRILDFFIRHLGTPAQEAQ